MCACVHQKQTHYCCEHAASAHGGQVHILEGFEGAHPPRAAVEVCTHAPAPSQRRCLRHRLRLHPACGSACQCAELQHQPCIDWLHCADLQQGLAEAYLLGMCAALSSSDQRHLHLQNNVRIRWSLGKQKASDTSTQSITPSEAVDELSCHSSVSSAGCMLCC